MLQTTQSEILVWATVPSSKLRIRINYLAKLRWRSFKTAPETPKANIAKV